MVTKPFLLHHWTTSWWSLGWFLLLTLCLSPPGPVYRPLNCAFFSPLGIAYASFTSLHLGTGFTFCSHLYTCQYYKSLEDKCLAHNSWVEWMADLCPSCIRPSFVLLLLPISARKLILCSLGSVLAEYGSGLAVPPPAEANSLPFLIPLSSRLLGYSFLGTSWRSRPTQNKRVEISELWRKQQPGFSWLLGLWGNTGPAKLIPVACLLTMGFSPDTLWVLISGCRPTNFFPRVFMVRIFTKIASSWEEENKMTLVSLCQKQQNNSLEATSSVPRHGYSHSFRCP